MKTSHLIPFILLLSGSVYCQSWSAFGSGLDYPVNSISIFNNQVYAAGGGVYVWSGTNWIEKSNGMILLMDVYTLAVYNSTLYAGGFFTVLTPEGNWYNNAARYNNGSWTTCGSGIGNDGSGMSDHVNFMLVHNGQLFAGGRFGSAGGTPLNPQETPYIASFDGSLWHPVSSGMDFTVTDLAVHNNELIAAGFFTQAGGLTANYIAKWNGSVWSAIGSGMDAKVTALASYNGELYAGGLFSYAGGNTAASIAKWNGQSWTQVGNGISGGGQVYTLAVYNNELYAGGTFTSSAGNAGSYIMKWNGQQWSNMGAGTNGPVIFLYPGGNNLYIGGQFTNAGGIPAKNIVMYSNITSVNTEINNDLNFSLQQNYPNPFNPSTTIRYSVPSEEHVVIKIFDILSNEIETIVNELKPAGTYEITWTTDDLKSGVYFYQIISGSLLETRKMILVK